MASPVRAGADAPWADGHCRSCAVSDETAPGTGIVDPYELSPIQVCPSAGAVAPAAHWVWQYWQDPEQQVHDFRQQTLALSTGWGYTARAFAAPGHQRADGDSARRRHWLGGQLDVAQSGRTPGVRLSVDGPMPLRPRVQAMVAEWYGRQSGQCQACALREPAGESVCDDSPAASVLPICTSGARHRPLRQPAALCALCCLGQDYARIVAGR